jgi:type IV pilus biogenesis protein CpaD/CtpE
VAPPEFFFAIDFSNHTASREMFREVVTRVLAQAGCGPNGILDALQAAVEQSAALPCRVTFVAQDGRLDIVLSSAAGQVWQTTQPLA